MIGSILNAAGGTAPDAATRRQAASMPAFLTDAQKLRLARIVAGRDLFRGRWRKHLLTEGRTAHLFKALLSAAGRERPLLVTVNVLGLAARKTADLLMLDAPGISADDGMDAQAEAIERINQASHIESVLYEGALSACYEGEAWVQVMRYNGQVILANVPADYCWPVGDLQPDGTYPAVEKTWLLTAGTGRDARRYLRKEVHAAGLIRNELWRLNAYGRIDGPADLAAYYGPAAPPPEVATGVPELLLDFVPNFMLGAECISDFDGVDEIVDEFAAAVSQAAGVIAKHSDPKLAMPAETAEAGSETGTDVSTADDLFYVREGQRPEYIVWNAQLDSALKMIDRWLDWLMAVIEMSPGLLGLRKGGAPEAWRKLRLEATNTLAKVARKKLWWHRFVIDRYRVAHALENATPGFRYDYGPVSVDWHDGIPLDEGEATEAVAGRRAAGLVDRRTGVEELYGPERAEEINERLDAEDADRRSEMLNLAERSVPEGVVP